ncbi:MAG TPA: outer membrane protein assembly factor BamA [Candidatus Omnitrophota bacterium]|nr:outer membrane protein assembly factor BamA [Candidatus Omnitrophota bacterium]
MSKLKSISFVFLCASVFLTHPVYAQDDGQGKIVKSIEVEGNKTISIATILSKIKTRVGQEYLQAVISDDLKRLYNTGYFSDVRVDRQEHEGGFKVIIYVDEKAIIEEVTFSKTRHISARGLARKIDSQAGKFLDQKVLKDDVKIIKDFYASKGLTSVTVEPETFIDEVTNKASLHFVIEEGHKIRIKDIKILGNVAFPKKKIQKVLKTRTKWWFRSGYLNEEVIEEDMDRIKSFYEQQGYIDATATYTTEALYKGFININIVIDEGRRYSVGTVDITGNSIISEKEIRKVMKEISEGSIFSRDKLSVDVNNIQTLYFDRGYIFAKSEETTAVDPSTGKVNVRIDVEEGSLAYIEKVIIQGNARTRDIVIRRELKLIPGDRFDGAKLRRSKEKLDNLGYFEEVNFDIQDTDTLDRKDLVVNVKEAKTGTFSFGGGFSTVDDIVGFVEIQQRNFDFTNWPTFTGGGQKLSLRAETGSHKNNFYLSFTEPWLFDHPVSAGFDIFMTERERSEDTGYAYDEERTGGRIRFGKQFTEFVQGGTFYRLEEVDIGDFEAGVSADLLAEGGSNTVSMVGFTLNRDSTDNVFSPTKGLVLDSGFDYAGGFLGGDKDFYRLTGGGSYYIPLSKIFNGVLEIRVKGGLVDAFGDADKVPIFERFFAGGANSIRGYDERNVGPIDTGTNDPIGGEAMVVANIEYTIPVIEFIKFAVFLDTGNVWATLEDFGEDGLLSGTGLGFRFKTPIGPIKLDYGFPLDEQPGDDDDGGKFYFSVSRGF